MVIVQKLYTDKYMESKVGKNFNISHYKKIYKSGDLDCYYLDDDGTKKILFKIRRKVIPRQTADYIFDFFKSKVNTNKTGKESFRTKGENTKTKSNFNRIYTFRSNRSKITGFYDKSTYRDINTFGTTIVCRKTAFTRDNFKEWKTTIPFFELIGKQYKSLAPDQYKKQMNLFKKCPPGLQIGHTPFTTITSNYNWRTACHKDKGDYPEGMGNLTILGGKFTGGYLGFPQFGIAVDVRPRDTVIMDVHQWHCNTELETNDTDSIRLSFVSYFREKMVECDTKKVINNETYYYRNPK